MERNFKNTPVAGTTETYVEEIVKEDKLFSPIKKGLKEVAFDVVTSLLLFCMGVVSIGTIFLSYFNNSISDSLIAFISVIFFISSWRIFRNVKKQFNVLIDKTFDILN